MPHCRGTDAPPSGAKKSRCDMWTTTAPYPQRGAAERKEYEVDGRESQRNTLRNGAKVQRISIWKGAPRGTKIFSKWSKKSTDKSKFFRTFFQFFQNFQKFVLKKRRFGTAFGTLMKCRRTAPVLAYARTMVQGNCPVFAPGGRNGAKRKKSIRGCGAPHFRSGSRHSRHICLVTLFRATSRTLTYPQDSYCVASAPCPCNIHRMFLRVPLKQHSCNRGRTTKKWKIIFRNFARRDGRKSWAMKEMAERNYFQKKNFFREI